MVKEHDRIYEKIPEVFTPLMGPHFEAVNEVLSPGLTLLRWNSINLESFAEDCNVALKLLELLVDRANNVLEIQIEAVLKEVQETKLCELPGNEPWTVEQFTSKAKVSIRMYLKKIISFLVCSVLGSVREAASSFGHEVCKGGESHA